MFYVITFSPTGGTKKSADLLSSAWSEKTEISLMDRKADFGKVFTAEDVCLVAVPSFAGRVPAFFLELSCSTPLIKGGILCHDIRSRCF